MTSSIGLTKGYRPIPSTFGRHRAWLAVGADGDIGEDAFGHLDLLLAGATPHPAFDLHRDRRGADLDDLGVAADLVANEHRPMEGHAGDRNRRGASSGAAGRHRATGEIHLGQHPAAEDVAPLIGVGGHRDGAHCGVGLRRLVGGLGGVHVLLSWIAF